MWSYESFVVCICLSLGEGVGRGLLKIGYRACIIAYGISLLLYLVTSSSSAAESCRGTIMDKETSELVPSQSPGTQEAHVLV